MDNFAMKHFLAIGVFGLILLEVAADSVFEVLQQTPDYSKFYDLVRKDETAESILRHKSVTVFVPHNRAVEEAEDKMMDLGSNLPSYHILMQLAEKNIFPSTVTPFLSAAAPLFMNIHESEDGTPEYFVNNARIVNTQEVRTVGNIKQLLYVIDEVLEPFVSTAGYPPEASLFLTNPGLYGVKQDVGAFLSRVRAENQEKVFGQAGNHTYFIPIGLGDADTVNKLRLVDSTVIQGHVIPGQVLFTRVMGLSPYKSQAYKDDVKVEISLLNSTNSKDGTIILKVQSNTLQSGPKHRRGVVLAEIVRANIPVKNGVVHLISSPLMLIDITIWQFIQSEQEGRLSRLNELINYAADFRYDLLRQEEKTFFAPNNEAIDRLGAEKLKTLKTNESALHSLLYMHMVKNSVSTDDVNTGRITEFQSADARKKLYFTIVGDERNRTLSVQGGGVNALAVQADVGATDGIIHIIDRVLGMPYLTVYETLKETKSEIKENTACSIMDVSDPRCFDFSETYQFSSQDNWNVQLNDLNKKFTFFAPSNEAWKKLEQKLPTPYKQIQMGSNSYYVNKIFDRHLMVGRDLNAHDLGKEVHLQVTNGDIKIERGMGPDDLYVVWEDIRAKIIRSDVQATNGIIHIIDHVLMKNRDLIKSEATLVTTPILTLVLGFFLTIL